MQREPDRWPRYNPSELKNARLSTRAMRERRKKRSRTALLVLGFMVAVLAATWLITAARG
jgi:hypothetical protein